MIVSKRLLKIPYFDRVGGISYNIVSRRAAEYDSSFGAPFCALVGSECSSIDLLNGRGLVEGGIESNGPNTIDSCFDGNYGVHHEDEGIDQITVRSGSINGSGIELDLEAGKNATIVATVYAYNDGSENYADFYYANNAYDPSWQYIGTLQPTRGGVQQLMMEYTLPDGDVQAVSVHFRHLGSASSCVEGGFSERDDIVFTVLPNSNSPT